jgi:SAM-dependent methyltransferase
MSILTSLPEHEQARQLGRPDGETGLALAAWLNGFNRPFILGGRAALGVREGSRVLEIGFGNGHDVAELVGMAEGVHYTGLEIAPTMVEEASRHNADLVAMGRARFVQGDVADSPFPPASFDRAIAINVIYFWADPVPPLAAIRRMLAPGGVSVIGAGDPPTKPSGFARPEYGFHSRPRDAVLAAHHAAGFTDVTVDSLVAEATGPDGTPFIRRFALFVARV